MNTSTPAEQIPRLHRDGTITYWSYYRQEWVRRAMYVPLEELEKLHPIDRERVERHLGVGA